MKKHIFSVMTLAVVILLAALNGCKKPEDNTPAPEGLYLGIVGFNSELYTMPLGLLNQNTKGNFEKFVDNLSMQNGTILYHAVHTGLSDLAHAKIPDNLINVSVVTFTDGLDQGSYVLGGYNSGTDYLNDVNTSIMNGLVGGQNISAYSIGVRGSDVSDIEAFRNNLNKLSNDPENNVFEVNDMNEASEKFAQIAQQLYNQSTFYNVTLKLPAQEPNTRIRFTFDNVNNDANTSQRYIEGTYIRNNGEGQLTDIHYEGMECQSGYTVTASSVGIFDVFSFRNLTDAEGHQVGTDYVKQWNLLEPSLQWQYNSEFTPSGNTEIVNEYKSAMIMLVLDCSSSLGNDFVNMKIAAKSFIETLSGNYNGK